MARPSPAPNTKGVMTGLVEALVGGEAGLGRTAGSVDFILRTEGATEGYRGMAWHNGPFREFPPTDVRRVDWVGQDSELGASEEATLAIKETRDTGTDGWGQQWWRGEKGAGMRFGGRIKGTS